MGTRDEEYDYLFKGKHTVVLPSDTPVLHQPGKRKGERCPNAYMQEMRLSRLLFNGDQPYGDQPSALWEM